MGILKVLRRSRINGQDIVSKAFFMSSLRMSQPFLLFDFFFHGVKDLLGKKEKVCRVSTLYKISLKRGDEILEMWSQPIDQDFVMGCA